MTTDLQAACVESVTDGVKEENMDNAFHVVELLQGNRIDQVEEDLSALGFPKLVGLASGENGEQTLVFDKNGEELTMSADSRLVGDDGKRYDLDADSSGKFRLDQWKQRKLEDTTIWQDNEGIREIDYSGLRSTKIDYTADGRVSKVTMLNNGEQAGLVEWDERLQLYVVRDGGKPEYARDVQVASNGDVAIEMRDGKVLELRADGRIATYERRFSDRTHREEVMLTSMIADNGMMSLFDYDENGDLYSFTMSNGTDYTRHFERRGNSFVLQTSASKIEKANAHYKDAAWKLAGLAMDPVTNFAVNEAYPVLKKVVTPSLSDFEVDDRGMTYYTWHDRGYGKVRLSFDGSCVGTDFHMPGKPCSPGF